jgi:hypothetical protein
VGAPAIVMDGVSMAFEHEGSPLQEEIARLRAGGVV